MVLRGGGAVLSAVPGHRILEHPADLGIEATGRTASEAFEQAALALMSVILDPRSVAAREERLLSVAGADPEQLLVRWLGEVLYLYDGQRFATREVRITRWTGTELSAVVRGEPLDPSRHTSRLDVKAVTYHQIAVREEAGSVTLQVYLDI